tara:strand:- start:1518 stop:1724 length:207 start_codon:yes stop_codon:yes gene_type:complete
VTGYGRFVEPLEDCNCNCDVDFDVSVAFGRQVEGDAERLGTLEAFVFVRDPRDFPVLVSAEESRDSLK